MAGAGGGKLRDADRGGGQAKAWNQHPEGTEALTKLKKIIKEELPQRSY